MAFLGQDTVNCKIFVDNKRLQKVKNFKYLGCEISCENEKNIQQNLENFSQILGILNNTFKLTLVQKFSRIKVYNALVFLNLLYGSEIWTLG
jgi:GR25 family glycosyltransferase involved in LPS biosynthesis